MRLLRFTLLWTFLLGWLLGGMLSPAYGQLVINEILADPASGSAGDANGDGTRSSTEDEFIELINTGPSLDMSGWTLEDGTSDRHVFPAGTILETNCVLVVFGGGSPTGTFGGAQIQLATNGQLNMSNSGDLCLIRDAAGDTAAIYIFGAEGGNNESLTRDPDITGVDPMVVHSSASGSGGAIYSPGTLVDGSTFGCVPTATFVRFTKMGISVSEGDSVFAVEVGIVNPDAGNATTVEIAIAGGTANAADVENYTTQSVTFPAGDGSPQSLEIFLTDDTDLELEEILELQLQNPSGGNAAVIFPMDGYQVRIADNELNPGIVLNELHADPISGAAGDANGDGSRNATEDEFIELVSFAPDPVDMSNWTMSDEFAVRHEFLPGTILYPGCALVLFGGGNPTGDFGGAIVQTASVSSADGISLANGGDDVVIRDDQGGLILSFTFGAEAGQDQSLTRNPDVFGTDSLWLHSQADTMGALFSPGTGINSTPFACMAPTNTRVQFSSTNLTAFEYEDSILLEVSITNPAATATTVDVAYLDGSGTIDDISNFTTQTVTFPAGDGTNQLVKISLNDDTDTEGNETFRFVLQNIAGGEMAEVIFPDTLTLTLFDDESNPGLIVNEVHADPASDITGDANGDGVRDAVADEFIEFVNMSSQAIDISGWEIYDADLLRHECPPNTIIGGGCAFVVFGGDSVAVDAGGSSFQVASAPIETDRGLNLNNGGDQIILKDSMGNTVLIFTYGSEGSNDQSITRNPDKFGSDAPLAMHTEATGDSSFLFSPGQRIDGTDFCFATAVDPLLEKAQFIDLFPNPATSKVTLTHPVDLKINGLEILNMKGQRIQVAMVQGPGEFQLETGNLMEGMYLIQVLTDQGVVYKKLLIQR